MKKTIELSEDELVILQHLLDKEGATETYLPSGDEGSTFYHQVFINIPAKELEWFQINLDRLRKSIKWSYDELKKEQGND